MKSREVRKKFIEFFKQKNHTFVPSSSTIPVGDKTILFTIAGMAQFKDALTGVEKRPYNRATNSQKCIRIGDLDDVGHPVLGWRNPSADLASQTQEGHRHQRTRRRADRRDGGRVRARARPLAAVDGERPARRRGAPRVDALLAAPGRRVVPLRLARQEAPVPDAERLRIVPGEAVLRTILVRTSRRRPCRCGSCAG